VKYLVPAIIVASLAGATALAFQMGSASAAGVAASPAPAATVAKIGEAVPSFAVPASSGKTVGIEEFRGKWVILEWVNKDCPFVRKFYEAGAMQEFQRKAKEQGVVWLSVCSSNVGKQGHMTAEGHNAHMKAVKAEPHALLMDVDGRVGRMFDARTTPQMVLIDPNGVMLYNGAIDDKPSPNPADIRTARNHIFAALEEAKAGKPVSVPTTRPYGCGVKY
jgi:peroxiredoxin